MVSRSEVLQHLVKSTPGLEEFKDDEIESVLRESIRANDDLKEALDPNGAAYYYSSLAMSEPYARILIAKMEDPLALIAAIVRENSAIYPRPVPVESFKGTPFEMTEKEIGACLERIALQEDLQDIRPTITSTGAMYLFSTRHMEPDHAAMLAEWLDVGPLTNP